MVKHGGIYNCASERGIFTPGRNIETGVYKRMRFRNRDFTCYYRYPDRATGELFTENNTASRPLKVLDVGGHHYDFYGQPRRPIAEALPSHTTITVDVANNDLREMTLGKMDRSGEGSTKAGKICGMIATILSIVIVYPLIITDPPLAIIRKWYSIPSAA